jgi:tripartite-type tricarboxylate transporter receptor subunit TctC
MASRVKSGEIRALAVTGSTRWKELPDIPTVEEAAGVRPFDVISWTAVALPAGVRKAVLDRLQAEVRRAIALPEIRSKLESMGGEVRASTPAEMRALVAAQLALWKRVVQEQNIRAE